MAENEASFYFWVFGFCDTIACMAERAKQDARTLHFTLHTSLSERSCLVLERIHLLGTCCDCSRTSNGKEASSYLGTLQPFAAVLAENRLRRAHTVTNKTGHVQDPPSPHVAMGTHELGTTHLGTDSKSIGQNRREGDAGSENTGIDAPSPLKLYLL